MAVAQHLVLLSAHRYTTLRAVSSGALRGGCLPTLRGMKGCDLMAGFYSFGRIKVISRSGVKSAVATAAYHAGISLTNEYDGITHDYSYKQDVGETFVRMPDTAPKSWRDESVPAKQRVGTIWNDVERAQPSTNAQLARSNFIALPHNLTVEQGLECVDRFIEENCTSKGMGVTYSLHDKPNNRHVDMMYLMREYDESGKPREKSKKEYLCRKGAWERYMDAEKLKNSTGYEKVYKYEKDGERADMTPSEAAKAGEGWQRVNKYPVCRTVKTGGWDDKDLAQQWRKSWEEILNDKYKELGMSDRVDCRSFKDRGIGVLATVHEGHGPGNEERKAHNQQVKEFRKGVVKTFNEGRGVLKSIEKQIDDLENNVQTEKSLKAHERRYAAKQRTLENLLQSGFYRREIVDGFKKKISNLSREMRGLIETWRGLLKRLPEASQKLTEAPQKPPKIARKARETEKAANDTLQYLKKATEGNPAGQNPEKKHKNKQPSRNDEIDR